MFYKTSLIAIILSISGSLAEPLESLDTCVTLAPGQYTISTAENGWQLRPYYHTRAPPGIEAEEAAPTGQYGVWTLENAPQSAYYIGNVGEDTVVRTLPYGPVTVYGGAADPFAIECAGDGTYIIKNPVADSVWTAEPRSLVTMIGDNGAISQHFRFTAV